jgi:hypothetical protein
MMSTCNGGREFFLFFNCPHVLISFAEYTVFQLQPGWVYFGPSGIDNANLCECSTVGYSLYSACGACQEQEWVTYDHIVSTFSIPSILCIRH